MLNFVRRSLQLHYANSFLKCCSAYESLLRPNASRKLSVTAFQKDSSKSKLPQLPVPNLDDTLVRYLKSVQPFLSPDEYKVTEALVDDFKKQNGTGRQLQKFLEERASKEENWLSDWWLNCAYLEFRKPVVVWSSPGLVFPMQTFGSVADQLTYAANMVKAALSYKEIIDENKIPQDKIGNDPLDMQQYNKIFGTCRIPRPQRDQITYNNNSKHIIVMHNNHFFKLHTCYDGGNTLTTEDLYDNLLAIVEASLEKTVPVGILSTENRDTWAECYQILEKDNKIVLREIETSLFVLSLDSICDVSSANAQTKAALQTIHGGGSKCNSGNRWFDKTIQFIVSRSGEVGLTYEHSPAEGQPIAIMMDYIVDYVNNHYESVDTSTTRNYSSQNQKLSFFIPGELNEYIRNAKGNINKLVKDLDANCFTFDSYGKNLIKEHKYSPDSYIQMAQQYAFYRLHNVPGAHYESASTRRFLHGRTETIRSCSVESIKFAQVMLDKSASGSDKVVALKDAISSHKDYAINAMKGLGIDRHLLGLKLAAKELGIEVPKLFFDAGFVRSSHMRISTSQVASKCDGFMCYGPLVLDGYACCYNPREEQINFAISAFHSCKETSAAMFKESLENSLDDMKDLITAK
ncbi:hypothetical protein V9T40_007779 [Parthenolecanium corni]|uniref:Choline/carnitine acyltransferase domain-containing protein n=1 Tax=Parthenolecanium corni TaxID=536013 RepID=A0AAN9TK03_9HEMI